MSFEVELGARGTVYCMISVELREEREREKKQVKCRVKARREGRQVIESKGGVTIIRIKEDSRGKNNVPFGHVLYYCLPRTATASVISENGRKLAKGIKTPVWRE